MHDVAAKEVDKHTFYHLREDGGTKISSAFRVCKHLLDAHYSPDEWNIYLFHFSDGAQQAESRQPRLHKAGRRNNSPSATCSATARSPFAYGSGKLHQFVLHEHRRNHEKVLTSRVNSKDDIYDSLKTFFGKGH